MTDRELLKYALNTLIVHQGLTRPLQITVDCIEKLQDALAQPDQEQLVHDQITYGMNVTLDGKRIDPTSIYKDPEQAPVSHLWECIGRWSAYLFNNGEKANLAPPEWLVDAVKAATAPQRKPWVGLTDEEIEEAWGNTPMMLNARDGGARRVFARAIEAKLKERNT